MTSASSRSGGPSRLGSSCRSCWPSPSSRTTVSYPCSSAYLKPVWTAPPMPRLNGGRTTAAPAVAARSAVASVEPSSITTTSSSGSKARSSETTPPTAPSSLRAGTIASLRTGLHRSIQADEREQLLRPVRVGVLVEDALARAVPIASAWLGSSSSSRYARRASSASLTTSSSSPGSNQRSIPS